MLLKLDNVFTIYISLTIIKKVPICKHVQFVQICLVFAGQVTYIHTVQELFYNYEFNNGSGD